MRFYAECSRDRLVSEDRVIKTEAERMDHKQIIRYVCVCVRVLLFMVIVDGCNTQPQCRRRPLRNVITRNVPEILFDKNAIHVCILICEPVVLHSDRMQQRPISAVYLEHLSVSFSS